MRSIFNIAKNDLAEKLTFLNFHFSTSLLTLGTLMTTIYLMYIAIEPTPRWLLLLAGIVAILGSDGVLRNQWIRVFNNRSNLIETTPYLFLPGISAFAIPLLIENNLSGAYAILMAIIGGFFFTAIVGSASISLNKKAPNYSLARIISTFGVYFTGFTFFSLTYLLNLSLIQIIFTTGLVGFMLGMEIFREHQENNWETLLFSITTGIILAEFRWASYYMPFGGYVAGIIMLLMFFITVGLLLNYQIGNLTRRTILEYSLVTILGMTLIILARNLELI